MLWSFCVLLACQAAGAAVHAVTGVPVPGTILGIGLLACREPRNVPAALPVADALLPYLSLMFVPPAIVASSVLALVVAGRLAQVLLNAKARQAPAPMAEPSFERRTQ